MYNPSTVEDAIALHKDEEIKHEKLYLKTSIHDTSKNNIVIFNFHPMVIKYIDIIRRDYITDVELSDNELNDYMYSPKKFCKNNYGTPELWSALLLINNMVSVTEFTKKKIKIFTPDILTLLEEVFILEEREINENAENMSRMKVEMR